MRLQSSKTKSEQQEIKKKQGYDRVQKFRINNRLVERLEPVDLRRRKRLEKNFLKWARFYFKEAFKNPFGEVHEQMAKYSINAIKGGTSFCLAAPRGTGKSTIEIIFCLYCLFVLKINFPVYIPWSDADKKRALNIWESALCFNHLFAGDYPEYCSPFKKAKGQAQRLQFLMWKDDMQPCGAKFIRSEGLIVFPDGRGVLGCSSINGNPRGMNYSPHSGEIFRPDLVLIDDPQSKDTAKTTLQINNVIDMIDTDIMGLAGPNKQLTILMICTVLNDNDVATHYLNNSEWKSYRVGQVKSFPYDFLNRESKTRKLWEDWNRIRLEELDEKSEKTDSTQISTSAISFYKKHKKEMNAGFKVTWESRFDKTRKQPDAYFSAMWDFFRMGEKAFMSERQNMPLKDALNVYDLSSDIIKSRTSLRMTGTVGTEYKTITAATDINHYGLHSVIVGFKNDQSAEIIGYFRLDNNGAGIVPKNCPELKKRQLIFSALCENGRALAGLTITSGGEKRNIDAWLIDGGYELQTVQAYVQGEGKKLGVPMQVIRGYASKKYKPTARNCIGMPREMCHLAESSYGRWIAANVDYWREIMQRAWLGEIGAPGAINLPQGHHEEFIDHLIKEKLSEKLESNDGIIWVWATALGWHDWADALVYCYVASAWLGISATQIIKQQKRKVVRRAKVSSISY